METAGNYCCHSIEVFSGKSSAVGGVALSKKGGRCCQKYVNYLRCRPPPPSSLSIFFRGPSVPFAARSTVISEKLFKKNATMFWMCSWNVNEMLCHCSSDTVARQCYQIAIFPVIACRQRSHCMQDVSHDLNPKFEYSMSSLQQTGGTFQIRDKGFS